MDRGKPNVSGGLFPDRESYLIELSRFRTSHVVDILGDSGRVVDLKLHMYVLHVLAETFQSKERRKERLVGREEIRSPLLKNACGGGYAASSSSMLIWDCASVGVHRPPVFLSPHTAPHPNFEASDYIITLGLP